MSKVIKLVAKTISLLGLKDFFVRVEWELSKSDRKSLADSLGLEGEELTRFMREPS
jgi:hypothetical protein